MIKKFRLAYARAVARELSCPRATILSNIIVRRFEKRSAFLEKAAVKLLNIQPDDKVLEIGYGSGIGLRTAYEHVAKGSGIIFGVERSNSMFEKAKRYCVLEKDVGKVNLSLGLVTHLSFPDAFFDKIFHCNCYYYWPNLILSASELRRVMKPGGLMVTTICFDDLKEMQQEGYLDGWKTDPIDYLHALETVGFEDVHVKYLTETGNSYQGIFATRPLIEPDTNESFDEEEERFRKAMAELETVNRSNVVNRPIASDYDPFGKKSKTSTDGGNDPAVTPSNS